MRSPWLKPIKEISYSLLLLLFIYSGMDTYFDNSGSLSFISGLGLNVLFLLCCLISLLLSFGLFMLHFDGRFSDKNSTIFSLLLSFTFSYLGKTLLISSYGLVFVFEPIIITGELLLMALPLYFAHKTLKEFGEGFKN